MLEKKLLLLLYLIGLTSLFFFNFQFRTETQFESLAKSLTQGRTYLDGSGKLTEDGSYYQGHSYWPQGVFPAIVLIPGSLLFKGVALQSITQFLLNLCNLFLLYRIGLRITKNKLSASWLAFAYIFSTAYIAVGMIPWSWYFAQVVATTLLLFAINEYYTHRRLWVMGLSIACAIATRVDLIFALIFFLIPIVSSHHSLKKKSADFLQVLIPIGIGLSLLAFYNLLRFHSFFEFGYKYHIPSFPTTGMLLRAHGAWSLFYFPTNIYYLFFKGFDLITIPHTGYLRFPYLIPSIWGMSIFITSPIFIWVFLSITRTIKISDVRSALVTTIPIVIFLLGFFGTGVRQFGYRYALDFSPFLFIILCYSFQKRMSTLTKAVISFSFIIALFLFPIILFLPLE